MPWWGWVLVGWAVLAVVVAVPLGMAMRIADERSRADAGLAPVASRPVARARVRRRRLPVPPLAAALIGVGVTLESVGLGLRIAGNDRGVARYLSMDAPLSVPRMWVTALLATATVAAFVGAARATERRPWWLGVGVVAALAAQVKGGGTVHVEALRTAGLADRPVLAAAVSAALAGLTLSVLWWLSRTERRDRRRVMTAFAVYAAAAVGLSGVSSVVGSASGTFPWAALATFVEESGEAVGAVAVLTAVLVGVAPRLVLPADWALRRRADAETVDAPGALPAWRTGPDRLPGWPGS
ncbi:hypothetical protein GCM10023328_24110 [Modestobacter marinus]|uniref:Uncharacterized protein n=1 Tax=Modestobacter marinus TaxID=477641 RepID=A0A846LGG4_9ACTN|nr:hypothetical protein [Modestobacter marinus]NIH66331.1 hypothetical protein [Modestobacter marinus]GGL62806.1 hypothetical protein GCM10011589_18770 [Modestobacter marinus]